MLLLLSVSYRETIINFFGPFSAAVSGVIYLFTEFGGEIYGWAQNRLQESSREKSIKKTLKLFEGFIEKYFGLKIEINNYLNPEIPIITLLDRAISSLPENSLGNSVQHIRRLKIIPLVFLLKYRDTPDLLHQEDVGVITKIKFNSDFTEGDKKEFFAVYNNLVVNDRNFQEISDYFDPLQENSLETIKLHFLDNYMKDDYIKYITEKLKFSDKQTAHFKKSIEAVAKSKKFNLKYLREFIVKRKKYRKLFLIVSKSGLSKRIQGYIKQNPYFVLNYTSIDNLPKIGRSKGLDIFFFSPTRVISNSRGLLQELRKIDREIDLHPIKIYEVDPFESVSASLGNDVQLYQSIQYFENLAFDSTQINDVNYAQTLSILEHSRISIKDVISELPITEFCSFELTDGEKLIANNLYKEFVNKKRVYNIFGVIGNEEKLFSKIRSLKKDTISKEKGLSEAFSKTQKFSDIKKRLLDIAVEINNNISSLNSVLTQ